MIGGEDVEKFTFIDIQHYRRLAWRTFILSGVGTRSDWGAKRDH